jgi:type I restriction enzyme S subunit
MNFQLSSELDGNKVFLLNRSDLKERLEPKFYTNIYYDNEKKLDNSKYTLKRIGDVTQLVSDGTHFTPKYTVDGVKFISVKDVRKSKIDFLNTKYISVEEANKLDKRCKPQFGDLLLTKIGATFGFASIVSTYERFQIFVSVALLRPSEKITPEYLEVFLNSNLAYTQYHRVIKGAGVPDLHLEDIRKIKLPLPEYREQVEITSYYFEAYKNFKKKEAKAQQLLDSIDDYLLAELGIELPEQEENTVQSRIFTQQFKSIIGKRLDPIFYFSDLNKFNSGIYDSELLRAVSLSFISGVGAGKQDQSNEVEGIIQIRPTNINRNGALKYDKNVYLPKDFQGVKIEIDEVLFNNTNSQELVGKTTILKEEKELFFSNHITKIKVNTSIIYPDYMVIILNAYQRSKIFYSICTNWNNQSGIGLDVLKSLIIPVPPLQKQTQIANHITDLRNQAKQLQQQAKAEIEQAKKQVEAMILGDA